MPEMTPARAALGCGNAIAILSGFGVGMYLGLRSSQGVTVDPFLDKVLSFGPMTLSGLIGFVGGNDIAHDERALDEVVPMPYNVPSMFREEARDQMKGCMQGCGPIMGAGISTIITGLGTAVGYYIGRQLG
jgi:hypothetical protein